MRLSDRLGGHLVQGHVDAVGDDRRPRARPARARCPPTCCATSCEKGSITVDGVSLTVAAVHDDGFTVAVIPHTAEVTTLGHKGPGDPVNLEVDVVAKYVESLLEGHRHDDQTLRPVDDRERRATTAGRVADIEEALEAFARGEILVVVDDEDRENEGDLIMAAEHVTPEKIAFFLHHTSGFICAPITSERAAELDLRPMVEHNTESMRTAFLVSVDYRHGTTTGISAFDRAATVQALVDPATRPGDLARPGHILPLEAREPAACSSGPATPRPPSTSPAWPACTRRASSARSSTRRRWAWPASPSCGASPTSTACS